MVKAAGFSLIELAVVIAIVGILAAMAIPNYLLYQEKARQTEGKGYLSAIYAAEKSFFSTFGSYVSCLDSIGVIPSGGGTKFNGKGVFAAGFNGATTVFPSDYTAAGCQAWAGPSATLGGSPAPAATWLPAAASAGLNAPNTAFIAGIGGNIQLSTTAPPPKIDQWTINDGNSLVWTNNGL